SCSSSLCLGNYTDLHPFPTRRSSDLTSLGLKGGSGYDADIVLEEIELAELPQGQLLAAAPAEISKPLKSERGCVVGKILEAGRRACGKKVFSQIGGNIADVTQRAHQVGPELDAVPPAGDRDVFL